MVVEPSLSCKRLLEIVGGMTCRHPFLFALQAVHIGGGRSPEVTQEGPIEHVFGKMNNDCSRDVVKTPV